MLYPDVKFALAELVSTAPAKVEQKVSDIGEPPLEWRGVTG